VNALSVEEVNALSMEEVKALWHAEKEKERIARDAKRYQFYPTPPDAVRALLRKVEFKGKILEPACGTGNISMELIAAGYDPVDVLSSDYGDFGYGTPYTNFFDIEDHFANVVTNPPFSKKQKKKKGDPPIDPEAEYNDGGDVPRWIRHALRLATRKVALLLPLFMLGGKERYTIYQTCPPRLVLPFVERLSFVESGSEYEKTCAWFVWHKGFKGKPEVEWLP